MKTFYKSLLALTITLLVAHTSSGQTNVYHPFPENDAFWRMDCYSLGFFCSCNCANAVCVTNTDRQDYYDGDTLINGLSYHKVYRDDYHVDSWQGPAFCNPGCNPAPNYYSYVQQYMGAIRQDSVAKQVYFYEKSASSEQLLYDFNLSIGDTVPTSYISMADWNYVYWIDSVQVGATYRTRYWLRESMGNTGSFWPDSGYIALIEGIGSTYGLLEQMVSPFESGCGLLCVNVDSTVVYPASGATCNFMTSGLGPEPDNNTLVTIAPNPAALETTISWNAEAGYEKLTLFNMVGARVREINIKGLGQYRLNTASIAHGMYTIQLGSQKQNGPTVKLFINHW